MSYFLAVPREYLSTPKTLNFERLLEASKRRAQHRDRKCQPFHPEEVIEVGVFGAEISGVGVRLHYCTPCK
jgi:hypothetical protein